MPPVTPPATSIPTPDPVPSFSTKLSGRHTPWSTARIKKFQAKKQRESLLRKRVIQHLHQVEQHKHGKQRRSIRLYIKHCNLARGPDAKPFCSCVLFGEEDYFTNRTEKTNGPSEGFRFIVHDGDDEPDSDDSSIGEEDSSDDSDINEVLERAEADY